MLMLRHIFVALLALSALTTTGAQDLHFSQFYHNPTHYNPALTGVFRGDWRAAGLYRSQWTSVPVSYRTFSGAFDWKALRLGANQLSVGLQLQHDKAGDAGLSWTQIGVTGSIAHALGEKQALSAGFGLALAQRTVDLSALKFKNQWTGEVYDPGLSSKENFPESSGFVPTISAGLNWHYEPSEDRRDRLDVGIGAFHLNKPAVNFRDNTDVELPWRTALNAQLMWQTNDITDVTVFALGQQMGKNREILFGGGVRRWLGAYGDLGTAVQFTLATRLGDALIPAFQLERGGWTLGLSYDWNYSKFDVATRGHGGVELAAVYRTTPPPPVKAFKVCPIF